MNPQSETRARLRRIRSRLSPSFVAAASRSVRETILRSPLLLTSRRVALYRAVGNEVNLASLEARLTSMGRACALPVLKPKGLPVGLYFQHCLPDTPMCVNRFGIPEPCFDPRMCIGPRFLGVVFMPLLGFDRQGNRLGMGGGFYDRALAFKHHAQATRPLLIGVAFDCQRVEALAVNAWDVAMDAVVTESGVSVCRPELRHLLAY